MVLDKKLQRVLGKLSVITTCTVGEEVSQQSNKRWIFKVFGYSHINLVRTKLLF